MTDLLSLFGQAEREIIAHIISVTEGRFQEQDGEKFPNLGELRKAFKGAKTVLEAVHRISFVTGSQNLTNVETGMEMARKIADQLWPDFETGGFVVGKVPDRQLRSEVIGEVVGYVLNADQIKDGSLDEGLKNGQKWADFLYRKGLTMALAIAPFEGFDPEVMYENAIYAAVGEKIRPHLPDRTQELLTLRPGQQ